MFEGKGEQLSADGFSSSDWNDEFMVENFGEDGLHYDDCDCPLHECTCYSIVEDSERSDGHSTLVPLTSNT